MIEFKLFDTSRDDRDLESSINEWLVNNDDITIISTNMIWDDSNVVYTILYDRKGKVGF